MTRLPSRVLNTVSTLKVSSAQLRPFLGLGTGKVTRTATTVLVKLVSFGTSAGQGDDHEIQRCTELEREAKRNPLHLLVRELGGLTRPERDVLRISVVSHPKYLAMETILKRGRRKPVRSPFASSPVPVEESTHRLMSLKRRNWSRE